MLRKISPRKKFLTLLVTIYLVSVPLISAISYMILRENALREAAVAGRLYLATVGAVKHYIAEDLRPLLYKEMPGRFLIQGMSRSYAAGRVAFSVQQQLPAYEYKNASLNPMNPLNAADDFEKQVIEKFHQNRAVREWSGLRTRGGSRFYSLAVAGDVFSTDCLKCHGDPATAPQELLLRYGTKSGFHHKAGELADAAFIYIPIGLPLSEARKITFIFISCYLLFGAVIVSIVNRKFLSLFAQIDEDKGRIAEINSELMNLNHDMETIITERTMNLIALSVADRVRNPATTIAATFKRILRKEELSPTLRERMDEMIIEAGKLESIVRDYEAVLRKRQTMFKMEDLNVMVSSILPLIETDLQSHGVGLVLNLSADPVRCMANRQLLRIAALHVAKNAVESMPDGGEMTISTYADQDHVFLRIEDSGGGIPQEDIDRIFSPFFSSKNESIGMGLPLAKQIVDEHKGHISVKSEKGGGTVFTLSFPVRWSEQELSK